MHPSRPRWSTSSLVLASLAAALFGGLLAAGVTLVSAHGGDASKVHACVSRFGTVRIIEANGICNPFLETALDWSKDAGAGGPSGPTGPSGPAGPSGPTGPASGAALRGLAVHREPGSYPFTVPAGTTAVLVELVGAGGGGGGQSESSGGGGGAGGYARAVVPVTPGAECQLIVGFPGAGGFDGRDGLPGEGSAFACGERVLVTAGGGLGGGGAELVETGGGGVILVPGVGGAGGTGALAPGAATGAVNAGDGGEAALDRDVFGAGGVGVAIGGEHEPVGGGGDGQKGYLVTPPEGSAPSGRPGYAMVQW